MVILLRFLVLLLGLSLVAATLFSAVQTFVLPRSAPDLITTMVFRGMSLLFNLWMRRARSYAASDRIMAFFAPFSLLTLLPVWLALVLLGYAGMFWAAGTPGWLAAFQASGSSLLTLGSASLEGPYQAILAFSEATLGLILVALLIAYLPTMYAAFSRREAAVTLLEVRAGEPPSAVEMIKRFYRIHGLERLGEQWRAWENWFADIDESHTSLGALVFFRSPLPNHSWVTAAGAVLDAASLTLAAVDIPHDPQADLCIRAGYLALRHIADFFGITYPADPRPGDPISVSRSEFESACNELAAQGVPVVPDRERSWQAFAGWRVNYDVVLLTLAELVMAPASPWTGVRSQDFRLPSFMGKKG